MIPLLAAWALLAASPAPSARLPTGEVVERLACRETPDSSYALYLPTAYGEDPVRPLVIMMDPRGRAVQALERIRGAAEHRGYVVMSSYDTRSDGPREPNAAALRALLPEAETRLGIDTRRIYLAGFSGTARAAWDFALALPGHVAGILSFGAGLPPGRETAHGAGFAVFGGAGVTDFNYQEMRTFEELLETADVPHRIRFYPGGHAWPPPEVFDEALTWMELQAVRGGLRPASAALVEDAYRESLAAARLLEAQPDLPGAFRRYAWIREDFEGLIQVTAADERWAELRRDPEVRRARKQENRIAARERSFQARFHEHLASLRSVTPLPEPGRSVSRLGIQALRSQEQEAGDVLEREMAARMLETVFVYTSFYETRRFLEAGDPARALLMVEIAAAARPGHPRVCWNRARALAQLGNLDGALEALSCVIAAGAVSRQILEAEPYLAPVRGTDAFRSMTRGMTAPEEE
ncbi:MAG: tetratricopeptide repeat protein [Acidobacteriota bacterium]